ncbi:unnamed protein product [Staurois parvus]|uniref:Uncharacterized protein n=1 Tax=Staurois parvus TaxID=386267 RepID=A0ABN9B5L5_9NEOB|nr:unnamed protein product [Staurois parvus]
MKKRRWRGRKERRMIDHITSGRGKRWKGIRHLLLSQHIKKSDKALCLIHTDLLQEEAIFEERSMQFTAAIPLPHRMKSGLRGEKV